MKLTLSILLAAASMFTIATAAGNIRARSAFYDDLDLQDIYAHFSLDVDFTYFSSPTSLPFNL